VTASPRRLRQRWWCCARAGVLLGSAAAAAIVAAAAAAGQRARACITSVLDRTSDGRDLYCLRT
jgi:hypothetical protein